MKTIKNEFKISFIKNENNYNNVKEVYCDSKSIFNYIMLVLSILFAIVCGYFMIKIFYFDFSDNRLNINFTNLLCVFGVLLLIIAPAVYFILKIVNFNFYINNDKINYKNIIGKTFTYSLNELISAEFFASIGENTVDCIVIKFNNKNKIKVSSTDRNFRLLKSFLISKNLLIK